MGSREKIMAIYRFNGVVYGPKGSLTLWLSEYNTEDWDEHDLKEHLTKMKPIWLESCDKVVPNRVKQAKNDYRLISYVPWDELMNEIEPKA